MSSFNRYKQMPTDRKEVKAIHPVWRGIGFLLIVMVPALSYIIATLLVDARSIYKWVIIPQDLVIAKFGDPFILVRLLYAAIFIFIVFAIVAIVTFIVNRFFGPPRYGPYDVKPK